MMYSNEFKNLVEIAYNKSVEYYKEEKDLIPNPFYIGFGNPNADVLIVGQEKAIDKKKKFVIKTESVENPWQWKKIADGNISDINYVFYEGKENISSFKNPLYPYAKICNGTWSKYQKLLNLIYPELEKEPIENSFFTKSFITEINHQPSPIQLGNKRDPQREEFLHNDYYKNFNVIILAIGDYLKQNEIEEKFDVKKTRDDSEPWRKLIIYKNNNLNRILLHTRQLSNSFPNYYLGKIRDLIKNYIH